MQGEYNYHDSILNRTYAKLCAVVGEEELPFSSIQFLYTAPNHSSGLTTLYIVQ